MAESRDELDELAAIKGNVRADEDLIIFSGIPQINSHQVHLFLVRVCPFFEATKIFETT